MFQTGLTGSSLQFTGATPAQLLSRCFSCSTCASLYLSCHSCCPNTAELDWHFFSLTCSVWQRAVKGSSPFLLGWIWIWIFISGFGVELVGRISRHVLLSFWTLFLKSIPHTSPAEVQRRIRIILPIDASLYCWLIHTLCIWLLFLSSMCSCIHFVFDDLWTAHFHAKSVVVVCRAKINMTCDNTKQLS